MAQSVEKNGDGDMSNSEDAIIDEYIRRDKQEAEEELSEKQKLKDEVKYLNANEDLKKVLNKLIDKMQI